MRFAAVLSMIALAFSALATPADAQGDDRGPTSPPYYINKAARFAVLFPGTPAVTDVMYTSANGARVPAKQYAVAQGNGQYNVTVVDFPAGPAVDPAIVEHAARNIIGKGTLVWQSRTEYEPGVGSRQIFVSLSDGRQIQAAIYMWDHRLFIVEGHGTPGTPALLRFAQSIVLFQANGDEVQGDAPPGGRGGGRGGN